MTVLMLSRLQFAMACFFHFLFVPLTLGLGMLLAIMETISIYTGDDKYREMSRFWGKLFLINFAIGIVTGITLEFQFGTNWSRYSEFVGDIFGSLLAIEATVAFFLESTFIAVWAFGWERVSKKVHCAAIWIVALAANASGFWILVANAWMQHPVGYEIRNGRAEMTDFFAVITQKTAFLKFFHVISSSWVLAGMVVMGVSAWHLWFRNKNRGFFKTSFIVASRFAIIALMLSLLTGDFSASEVAELQPAKFAAMESHWETQKNAPMNLIVFPDPSKEENIIQMLSVPSLLSLLAFKDPNAEVKGLKDFAVEDRPPVILTFLSFRGMVGLGTLMFFLVLGAWFFNNKIDKWRPLQAIMFFAIPIPYLTIELGWMLAEVGRQPWIVYGMMRTKDAVSTAISAPQVWFSFVTMLALYSLLGLADFYLLVKYARKGPNLPPHMVEVEEVK